MSQFALNRGMVVRIVFYPQTTRRTFAGMGDMKAKAVYALCGNKAGKETTLFLGNGTLLQTPRVTIKSEKPANVLLEHQLDGWYYEASADCTITIKGQTYKAKATKGLEYLGR